MFACYKFIPTLLNSLSIRYLQLTSPGSRSTRSYARFAVSSSHDACPQSAAVECATSITKQMGGLTPTLVLLFVNAAHYGIEMGQVAQVGQVGPSDR